MKKYVDVDAIIGCTVEVDVPDDVDWSEATIASVAANVLATKLVPLVHVMAGVSAVGYDIHPRPNADRRET